MYRTLPISSITIDRDSRQRRELPDLETLAASISQIGLINPIVVDQHNVLVAGERRLEACRLLGWDSIPTQLRDDLDPISSQLLELEENVKRADLTWKDECAAISNYHALRKEINPKHTIEETATELSMSQAKVYDRLLVNEQLVSGNTMVAAADKFSVARNLVTRANERAKAAEAESIARFTSSDTYIDIAQDIPIDEPIIDQAPNAPLMNVDFIEWVQDYSGPRFNFIHCDFPYGVNADKHHQGAAKYFRGYEDSPDVYWTLLAALGDNLDRIAQDSAHLIFWYSMDFHHETRLALEQMGWRVNPFPLLWFKSDNTGILPDPSRGPRRVYETAFFCSRGDRKIVRAVANCFPAPVTKTIHMSEKSLPMLQHFFRMVVDEHTEMLDPTCGSANAVKAADLAGAKRVLGLEKDPSFFELATEAWSKDDGQITLEL